MKTYQEMNAAELEEAKQQLLKDYEKYQDLKLNLNMARGKPSPEQLDMIMPMLDVVNSKSDCHDSYGTDCRNYGDLLGSMEARDLFADLMGIKPTESIIVGSSSLTFMYDCLARAMLRGVLESEKPWSKYEKIKWLCPVPGYDRHFTICELFGIEMIPVQMNEEGPDMDFVRECVKDPLVKGMWCIPKYSNPSGICYSDRVVKELAALEPAAKDFRIFWDNSYMVHYIYKDVPILNILEECKKAGHPNMVFMFGSTSKITMAGSGIGFFGASEENVKFTQSQITASAISWDKMNMLRHVRYIKQVGGVMKIMEMQAGILKPKFDAVLNTLDRELAGKGAGEWTKPMGGYFISFKCNPGCATRANQLCNEAGLKMTGPGATHPYHNDPEDAYLRIAPSYPSVDEIEKAMEIFCLAVQIATIEKIQEKL